jgi:hypothetical protein
MSDGGLHITDPRLLLEAARVFNVAGPDYRVASNVIAEEARKALEAADASKVQPEVRQAILADGAALRLSGRVGGGYSAALELLKGISDTKEQDVDGRLHLLRALANGQKYNEERRVKNKPANDPDLEPLRKQIRADLGFAFAFATNASLKEANRLFWRPRRDQVDEEDLTQIYEDDAEFRNLVEPPTAQAPAQQGVVSGG